MLVDDATHRLVGRDSELAYLDRSLAEVPASIALLVIEGETGIGKTTLWEAALARLAAGGGRVLVSRPTQAEAALSFAGLIDLLDGVVDDLLPDLPGPQRVSLETALLRRDATSSAEPGAVSVAATRILRSLAMRRPAVIAIDDLQWLDGASMQVLLFALRRLREEPIGVVITSRRNELRIDDLERAVAPERTRRLLVGPMSIGALDQMIHARLGTGLPRPTLVRIHELSEGTPLFALELARFLLESEGPAHAGRPLPVPRAMSDLLRARVRRCSRSTRRLLLTTAAMSNPRVAEVVHASALTQRDAERSLRQAQDAAVVAVRQGVVRFAHPMLASVVYDDATPADQRAVHQRLADLATDPEERARHLALAVIGPDERVARALDEGARQAHGRGATDVAAQLGEQGLDATPVGDDGTAYRRAMAAGMYAVVAGDRDRARRVLDRAVALAREGPERALALLRRAEIAAPLREGVALCDRALGEARDDPSLRSRIHRARGGIHYYLGNVAEAEADAATAVAYASIAADDEALSSALAELGHWTFCGGGGVRRDLFDRAIGHDSSARASAPRSHLATILLDGGHHDEAQRHLEDLMAESMRLGDVRSAGQHSFHLAELAAWSGDWRGAIAHADESLLLRQHADQPIAPLYVRALALAHLGSLTEARREAESGRRAAEEAEDVVYLMQHLYVLGFADLSVEDYPSAHRYLGRATDLLRTRWNREFGDCRFVPDEIEACVALGDLERADALVAWMDEVGRRTGRPWTLATGMRARALLEAARRRPAEASTWIERAVEAHDRLPMPFERARTLLARGVIERRARHRAVARASLLEALAIFERLGAPIWAARARADLDRLGVRAEAQRALTPVEFEIAAMVADGHTNREIATRLFLSPKTIEANLSRMYRKLDVRSRAELAAWSAHREPPRA